MEKGMRRSATYLFLFEDIISYKTTFTLNNVNIYKHVITIAQ